MDNLIALVFLVLGGGFVFTLLKGIMSMLSQNIEKDTDLGKVMLKTFMMPIICATLLIVFAIFILPNLK